MIWGKDIESLVGLLVQRRVFLFHACQFLDFQSYLRVGGIPSRACLEAFKLPFTGFETDGHDHIKGVWDKVFLNFSDFGKTFAQGGKAVPNSYGPILLQLHPAVLLEAIDVAVCYQPVGSSAFARKECALKSVADIDRLFVHSIEAGYPHSTWVKYKDALREEFRCSKVCDPDISCTVTDNKLPLKHVDRILVDPYVITGKPLRAWVTEFVSRAGWQVSVMERSSSRKALYNELVQLLLGGIPSCQAISQNPWTSEELRQWARELESKNLEYQFRRFATYLREGTLLRLA